MKQKFIFTMGSHMDLFWMGTTRDCLDRGCDIINRAIELCEKHPEYCFYIETVIFAEYFLKYNPDKHDKFMELVKSGRFEIGCTYVDRFEHHYGGEVIARHHILASRWLKSIGASAITTCHPDLPGMSPQVPQICAETGISAYLRARGPCGIFNWTAPDGTKITYYSVFHYGKINANTVRKAIETISGSGAKLPVYILRGGYSDLEMPDDDVIKRIGEFYEEFPDFDFSIGSPAAIVKYYADNPDLLAAAPRIAGEWPVGWGSASTGFYRSFQSDLYLENYLLTTEKITALSKLYGGALQIKTDEAKWESLLKRVAWGERRPGKIKAGAELEEMWKPLLHSHDHNLGGYGGAKSETDRETMKVYCGHYADEIVGCGMGYIDGLIEVPENVKERKPFARVTVFNQLAWKRDAVIRTGLPGSGANSVQFSLIDAEGNTVGYETDGGRLTFIAKNLPSLGFKTYYAVEGQKPADTTSWYKENEKDGAYTLDTPYYTVSVDKKTGAVLSIYDKSLKRELIQNTENGRFGDVISYEESGADVTYAFTGKKTVDSPMDSEITLTADSLSATIEKQTSIFEAKVVKRYTFYRGRPEIGVKFTIYWWGKIHEQLRLSLPFTPENFRATNYGVPFYHMEWPKMMEGVDDDTILGMGQINRDEIDPDSRLHIREVCKWIDVGYDGCGVAVGLKSPAAYIGGNNIEPILLRTGWSCGDFYLKLTNPGKHDFEYTLLPHTGSWKEAGIYRFGWENVNPPICRTKDMSEFIEASGPALDGEDQFLSDKSNIIVSSLKPAYDTPDGYTLRFFETDGAEGEVKLRCPKNVVMAKDVNMLEEVKSELKFSGREVTVPVKPYQIKTILLKME